MYPHTPALIDFKIKTIQLVDLKNVREITRQVERGLYKSGESLIVSISDNVCNQMMHKENSKSLRRRERVNVDAISTHTILSHDLSPHAMMYICQEKPI